jgi:hypothetical protein
MQSDMRNTRLYELLTILNFNDRKSIICLAEEKVLTIKSKELTLLKEIIKYIESKKKSKNPLYKKHLASLTLINEDKLNYLTNSLLNKISKILPSFTLFESYKLENSYLLTKLFLDQDLPKNIPLALKANRRVLENSSNRTHDFHFYEMKHHEFCTKRESVLEVSGQGLPNMQKNLDAFYAENKLKIFCEEINRARIFKKEAITFPNDSFEFSFLKTIKKRHFFNSISVELFFYIYEMLITNSEKSYLKALKVLEIHKMCFHPNLEDTVLRYMMNQSISFINTTNEKQKYIEHYINYVDRLKKIGKLFLANENYPLRIFHNIVIASTKVRTISWSIDFVETEIKKLNTSNQDYNRTIHLAHIELRNKNYKKAYHLITLLNNSDTIENKIPKNDIFLNLFYYQLCIQIYFKIKDDLSYALKKNDALRKYVERNEDNLSTSKKMGLDNFIRFSRRIMTTPKYSRKWDQLKFDISEETTKILYIDSIYFMINNKR